MELGRHSIKQFKGFFGQVGFSVGFEHGDEVILDEFTALALHLIENSFERGEISGVGVVGNEGIECWVAGLERTRWRRG